MRHCLPQNVAAYQDRNSGAAVMMSSTVNIQNASENSIQLVRIKAHVQFVVIIVVKSISVTNDGCHQ